MGRQTRDRYKMPNINSFCIGWRLLCPFFIVLHYVIRCVLFSLHIYHRFIRTIVWSDIFDASLLALKDKFNSIALITQKETETQRSKMYVLNKSSWCWIMPMAMFANSKSAQNDKLNAHIIGFIKTMSLVFIWPHFAIGSEAQTKTDANKNHQQ